MRLLLAAVLALHGAIHLMGFAKAFGYAALPHLKLPISPALGVVWLLAAVAFLTASLAVVGRPRWWWAPATAGVALSMVAIVPSWGDAKAGAVANAVILVAAAIAFFVDGPLSQRAQYDRDVERLVVTAASPAVRVVTDADLAPLPPPVQRYLRLSGVLGQPRVTSFRVRMHGRIRSGPQAPWMPIVAEQVNTVSPPARLYYLDATMRGLPVTGLHRYVGGAATMLVRLLGMAPVARDAGEAMTQAETVTLCNDICLFAPAALIEPAFTWTPVDDRQARVRFTAGAHHIDATILFGADGRLADFWSDDRGRVQQDGTSTDGQRWSTPISAYRRFGPYTLVAHGDARWHPVSGGYPYITLDIDDVAYGVVP